MAPDILLSELILRSVRETAAFGAALAPALQAGDVILLEGDVGAGKTHLARAIIRARLAAAGKEEEDIPSPTFTLVQTYDAGSCEIWHADLYRVGDPAECYELGLPDAFDTAVCLVEWPEALAEARPENALVLHLEMLPEAGSRRLRARGPEARWAGPVARARRLAGPDTASPGK